MTCASSDNCGLFKWRCALNRCTSCPALQLPSEEVTPESPLGVISYDTYKFQIKCKLHGLINPNSSFCQECRNTSESNQFFEAENL